MALRLATYQDAGYEPANGLRTATLDDLDEKSPAVTDYFKAVASGVGSGVVQPIGWLARKVGAENIGGGAERVGDQTSEYWRSAMSNEGQRALRHKIVDYDEQGNIRFDPKLSTIALSAAESLPSMLATAIPGAAVTKVGAAMKIAPALAGAVGFGAMEGIQAGAQNASDTGMNIRKMTPADLSKSPVYQELRTSGLTHEQAREETARRAENEVFARTAPSTALLGGGSRRGIWPDHGKDRAGGGWETGSEDRAERFVRRGGFNSGIGAGVFTERIGTGHPESRRTEVC
ncbi:MAG: hypothetical protein HQK86_00130 [Nitrospinae bacterium]|nr:hypothetical protein [Nitrospinota bacterium]MBF0634473.1 hypothetical protein [Nitrospinota bacterium]